MSVEPLKLKGAYKIILNRVSDERGYFMRTYDAELMAKHGLQTIWAHDSESFNARSHTVRGLHFQLPPFVETKIVRVSQGKIHDVIVDLRGDSETYGQWQGFEISEESNFCLYIPKGFAHGFCTLTDEAIVNYKMDAAYNSAAASGIRWNDPTLGINWETDSPTISARDAEFELFEDFVSPF
jgi:dTDP-4-dehydrorhamnose 3,5-epimerase